MMPEELRRQGGKASLEGGHVTADQVRERARISSILTGPLPLLVIITLIGVLIRLRGITWGLPYLYDPDEHFMVDPAVRFITTGDLNPHWFTYPASTVIYILGLAFFVYWVVGHFIGWFPDVQSFGALFWADPMSFYLIARVVAIGLATLAIPLTYALCRTMAGRGAALAAAAFVAVSPLHAEFSRVVRTDPLMTTFLLAALLCAVRALERQPGRYLLFSGAFVGLATATKFPGASGALIVVLAAILAKPEPPVPWLGRVRWLALAGVGATVGFFAAAPFVVTGVREVYWSLLTESTHVHLSATGARGLPNYLWYLKGPLRDAVGLPLELVALGGVVVSFVGRRRPRLLLAGFCLLFLLGIGLSLKRWDRWIVPLMPCVAILAAIGLETAVRAVARLRSRPILQDLVVLGLGVALVIPSAAEALQRGASTADTRDIAKAWVEGHLPRGSRVALENYAPPVSRSEYQVFVPARDALERDTTTRGFKGVLGELGSLAPLRTNEIDYALLSDFSLRFQAERDRYPDEVKFYDDLFRASDVLYEVRPTGRMKGPVIRVLKLRR